MSVEADLRTVLLTLNAVTALTGTGAAARIRPDKLHQDDNADEEHIIIEIDNEEHLNDLTGRGGRIMADVTLRCLAKTKAEARALAEAVKLNGTNPGTGLAGYEGTVNGKTFDVWVEDEQATIDLAEDGSDRAWYAIYLTCRATWATAI